jgi:hypothetical protein
MTSIINAQISVSEDIELIGTAQFTTTLERIIIPENERDQYMLRFVHDDYYGHLDSDLTKNVIVEFKANQKELNILYETFQSILKTKKSKTVELENNTLIISSARNRLIVNVNSNDGNITTFDIRKKQLIKLFGKS